MSSTPASRRRLSAFVCACCVFVCVVSGAVQAHPSRAEFAELPPARALAVSTDDPAVFGLTEGRNTDLAAATIALQRCDAMRAPDTGVCEIVRLNDEEVTRAADILAGVPQQPHPLYLWRYQGRNATVFLAGSIHLLKESLYPLPVQYEQAYAVAERLVVEVDTNLYTANEMQRKTRQYASLPSGQTLTDILPPTLYQHVRQQLSRYGLQHAAIDGVKPSLLMNQIVVARLLTLGYLPEFGIEQHFLEQGGSREILQLETLDEQLQLLFEQPLPVQIELLADTLEKSSQIEPVLAGMLVAWLSGDDEALQALFAQQNGDSPLVQQFINELLHQRNHTMAEKIRGFIESGEGTYFVLIGAAHYLGDSGIPALLAERGLQGHRITSDTPAALVAP